MGENVENKYDFINPYNFVPLKDKCNRGEYKKGNLSGVIEYSLLTKTPLFIPDTDPKKIADEPVTSEKKEENEDNEEKDKKNHKVYKFFTYNDKDPVIPGSEIRGMLRNYYEILTNSCLSAVDTDTVLSKRTSEVFSAGLLKKIENGYELYAAKDAVMRTIDENNLRPTKEKKYEVKSYRQNKLLEGQKVYISFEKRYNKNGKEVKPLVISISDKITDKCKEPGYVIKGEPGPEMKNKKDEKHCCHIFMIIRNKECIGNINNININNLIKNIEIYQSQNNQSDRYQKYMEQLKEFRFKGKVNEYFPVYYSVISKDNIMLSPASITREIYKTKIANMIGDYGPCTHEKGICPTCRLFGMLNGSKAITSRIRVADMKHTDSKNGVYESRWMLKPLATPRLQNLEFYMKKPAKNAWFWTYDYYIDNKGQMHVGDFKPEINGRKFYWHHPEFRKDNVTTNKPEDKKDNNISITPLKSGNSFTGKIYFEDITEDELNSLVFLLNAGDKKGNDEKEHGYKLGHAKPFGFGSVAMSVESVKVRVTENNNGRITRKTLDVTDSYNGELTVVKNGDCENFEKITRFKSIEKGNIVYPTTSAKDDKGYEWYGNNHKAYTNKGYTKSPTKYPNRRTQMVYCEYLKPMEAKTVVVDKEIQKIIRDERKDLQNKKKI